MPKRILLEMVITYRKSIKTIVNIVDKNLHISLAKCTIEIQELLMDQTLKKKLNKTKRKMVFPPKN